MDDRYDLARFVSAQDSIYPQVVAELRAGRKRSHWMWFIFPQLEGLGHSAMARRYAIGSIEEARAYLDHPLLGERLQECGRLVLGAATDAHAIFGSPDDLKFHSSMTLFERADPDEPVFWQCLDRFFGGRPDALTLTRL
jgi:uncharacterized protein (DUF1810 family)